MSWPCPNEMALNYLVWSISYYVNDKSLASNNMYDTNCLWLKQNYGSLPDWFRQIVSKDDLRAGTGFTLTEDMLPSDQIDKVMRRVNTDEEWTHGE